MISQYSYKNPQELLKFMSKQGVILPRAKTGLSKKDQKKLTQEIERARHLGLLPFTQTLDVLHQ